MLRSTAHLALLPFALAAVSHAQSPVQDDTAGARVFWTFDDADSPALDSLSDGLLLGPATGQDAAEDQVASLLPHQGMGHELATLPATFSLESFSSVLNAPVFVASRDAGAAWANSSFEHDAELLTPLAEGSRVFSWALADRVILAGVGSARVLDYRDRSFVVSAEAGFRLSPKAGLHMGYEFLETSAAGGIMSSPASGESLFARLQLRF